MKKSLSIMVLIFVVIAVFSCDFFAPPLEEYTVTYHANDADSGIPPEPQTKTEDKDILLAENSGNLSREGYLFAGWNTTQDGNGIDYAEGEAYTANTDLNLYSNWLGEDEKRITSFIFSRALNTDLENDIMGVFIGLNITLSVPFGTQVTSLIPSFTIRGKQVSVAGVTQEPSASSLDFTNPVMYEVEALDGSIQNYFVSIRTLVTRGQLDQMIEAGEDVTILDVPGITDMSNLFAGSLDEPNSFNQNISAWSEHVAETINHIEFSGGTSPLLTEYHPHPSWQDC